MQALEREKALVFCVLIVMRWIVIFNDEIVIDLKEKKRERERKEITIRDQKEFNKKK